MKYITEMSEKRIFRIFEERVHVRENPRGQGIEKMKDSEFNRKTWK